jgi:MSHA biogenesis protein MshQ
MWSSLHSGWLWRALLILALVLACGGARADDDRRDRDNEWPNGDGMTLPNSADLAIQMRRSGPLVLNQQVSYTLTVSNNGPRRANAPIAVVDILPAGLGLVSVSGAGWTCDRVGRLIGCIYSGSIDINASLPTINLTATVTAGGSITNTAIVFGLLVFDKYIWNNRATDTATVTTSTASYVLTQAPCQHGQLIGTSEPCKPLGPVTAGVKAPVYVTAIVTRGDDVVATQLNPGAVTALSMKFALACLNPNMPPASGAKHATYAGVTLPLCAADAAAGAWSPAVNLVFSAASPSARILAAAGAAIEPLFEYNDVGRVQLHMLAPDNNVTAGLPFVAKPARLVFTTIKRSSDGFPNPAATSGDWTTPSGYAFMKAGEAFTMVVQARTGAPAGQDQLARNFGNESYLGHEGTEVSLLPPATPSDHDAALASIRLPEVKGSFDVVGNGAVMGAAFSWEEVGIAVLTPTISNYLGAGAVGGDAVSVGRFYPDHFSTSIDTADAPMQCLPGMACPATVKGAAYSGQPFRLTVVARNAARDPVRNYVGVFAQDVTLSAFDQAGGAAENPPAAGAKLAANVIKASVFVVPNPDAPGAPVTAAPTYTLPVPFANTAPRALNWTGPTSIFLRASAAEVIGKDPGTGGYTAVPVTSLRGTDSVEGGITVINGRLKLSQATGSELLRMPVRMEAQYWSGTGPTGKWVTNTNHHVDPATVAGVSFSNCLKNLQAEPGKPACKAALALASPVDLALAAGVGRLILMAPGRGNNGSADLTVDNPPWLPSTVARAVFGIYKSPLIYIREMY